jgi:monoamine oxidase
MGRGGAMLAPMARTPLFDFLRRAARLARASRVAGAPPLDELIGRARAQRPSRRGFLHASLGAGTALALGLPLGCDKSSATGGAGGAGGGGSTSERVAIVGAGIAGLTAAWVLKKGGVTARVHEAAGRVGGRMMTARGLLAPAQTTELGGEFIDSTHTDLLELAKELGIELLDTQAPSEAALQKEAYFFGGVHHTVEQVITEFSPLAQKIAADYDSLGDISYHDDGGGKLLDETSIAAYLDQIGASGWVRDLLEVAYVTEYGRDAGEQSSLNLIALIGTDTSGGKFDVFGESDERYLVKGGAQRFPDELAKRMDGQIELGHKLVRLREKGPGYTLDFEQLDGGGTVSVDADFVILTLPFTILREVELDLELPPVKKKAIFELGYGQNAKILVGCDKRIWRDQGYSGYVYSDASFQTAWDASRQQEGSEGGLTLYSGGTPGIEVGKGSPASQAAKLMAEVEKVYPGVSATMNGNVARFHWPTHNLSKGSYACYLPGQWTTIGGAEIETVGNLFFAGEHTSSEFQGFMGGGAETGRVAAEGVLASLKG